MVVGFAFEDGHGAIALLHEEEAHHLMGERHLGERNLFFGQRVDFWRKTIGAANDKDQAAGARCHALLQIFGIFNGAKFAAAFVEQNEVVAVFQKFAYGFSFFGFLLFGSQRLGVFEFWDDFHFEGNVVLES